MTKRNSMLSFIIFFIWAYAHAQGSGQLSSSPSPSSHSEGPSATVDFTSALIELATVAPVLDHANLSDPVPLPREMQNDTQLYRLAAMMPSVSNTNGHPDPNTVLASIQPVGPDGDTGRKGKRQGTTRVIVVGDSISHANEGDFTWRYRISEWFQSQNVAVVSVATTGSCLRLRC